MHKVLCSLREFSVQRTKGNPFNAEGAKNAEKRRVFCLRSLPSPAFSLRAFAVSAFSALKSQRCSLVCKYFAFRFSFWLRLRCARSIRGFNCFLSSVHGIVRQASRVDGKNIVGAEMTDHPMRYDLMGGIRANANIQPVGAIGRRS